MDLLRFRDARMRCYSRAPAQIDLVRIREIRVHVVLLRAGPRVPPEKTPAVAGLLAKILVVVVWILPFLLLLSGFKSKG